MLAPVRLSNLDAAEHAVMLASSVRAAMLHVQVEADGMSQATVTAEPHQKGLVLFADEASRRYNFDVIEHLLLLGHLLLLLASRLAETAHEVQRVEMLDALAALGILGSVESI